MLGSVSTSNNVKSKSIITTISNGNTMNFGRTSEYILPKLEYVSPTKKASDHSISQLIAYASSNHSSVNSMAHQPQSAYNNASVAALSMAPPSLPLQLPPPASSSSSSSSTKNASSNSSSKSNKSDSHHRSQSSSNSSTNNNNNFLHTNNNSKQTASHLKVNSTHIIDLSSDTDDGEVAAKKSKHHKHKHSKKNKESGSSNSNSASTSSTMPAPPPQQPNSVQFNHMHHPAASMVSDEVDHNKIIHDLKVNDLHDLKVNRSLLRKYFDLQL